MQLEVIGKNGDWWEFAYQGQSVWAYNTTVTPPTNFNAGDILLVEAPPTPTPTPKP
jgi:hypothetical protein